MHIKCNLELFCEVGPCISRAVYTVQGWNMRAGFTIPKSHAWLPMFPDIKNVQQDKLTFRFDVALVDGAKDEMGGLCHATFLVWFFLEADRNRRWSLQMRSNWF